MAEKTICKIDGCGKPSKAHGLCEAHYWRLRRHGSPIGGGTPRGASTGSPAQFYASLLDRDDDECIVWPFAKTKVGYAVWHNAKDSKRSALVSRMVCEAANGPAPDPEMHAAHSCGKGHLGCVNPRHIRWATAKENNADKSAHGTIALGERHPSSKLDGETVRRIRLEAKGMKGVELSRKYGVSTALISLIVNRKVWQHI